MNLKKENKLYDLRKKRGLSMSGIARKIGVATSTYARWEKGSKIPSEALIEIAKIFGVSSPSILSNESTGGHEDLRKGIYYLEEGISLIKRALV